MLDNYFWNNTLKDWGISLLIIAGAFLLIKIISLFNEKILKRSSQKTRNRFDNVIYYAFESPILFGAGLLGFWIALRRLHFPDNITYSIEAAYKILVVLNVTWFFARLAGRLLEAYWSHKAEKSDASQKSTEIMIPVVRRAVLFIVWAIGIATALGTIGVHLTAVLGTLGIGGIAFALAAQDTVKNIFGGFTIFTDKPFSIGDIIKIDGFEGTIVDVGVRSTRMRNYDKRLITIPNYKIVDASIVNISAEPMRRVVTTLGLTYDTSPEKMRRALEILRDIPNRVKHVSGKDIKANFTEFADSSLVITFIYFIEKRGDIIGTTSEVNMEILSAFNGEGLNFAFPTQTLYLEKN
ncbi:MAG: mechanosensitive ion channel family protein [Prevotellaceae bacterium]|jgi:MscS family membrane protein|nr:mechanosensitive ion channel family protein [Prevotellaceae bacterium]